MAQLEQRGSLDKVLHAMSLIYDYVLDRNFSKSSKSNPISMYMSDPIISPESLGNIIKKRGDLAGAERLDPQKQRLLKIISPNFQAAKRVALADDEKQKIIDYEDSVITPAFIAFINTHIRTRYVAFIINFNKNATDVKGVVSEVESGGMLSRKKNKTKSIRYTMTTREIAALSDRGDKSASEHAKKVLEIIGKEWEKLGYNVDGQGTDELIMAHPNAFDETI